MHEIADKIEKDDIVDKLRHDLYNSWRREAADYIEALHKELKAAWANAEFHFANYEAMQQQLEQCRKMLEELGE